MYTKIRPFFLTALSPVHPGSGSDLGIVDLPIQREKHTSFPKIESSGIKGVIRENYRDKISEAERNIIFGPKNGDAHQAALGFFDARILFFPVKSVKGIFAWITCPDVLLKFQEIMSIAGKTITDSNEKIPLDEIPANRVTNESDIFVEEKNSIILEEHLISNVQDDPLLSRFANWFSENAFDDSALLAYQKIAIIKKMAVIENDVFRDFVSLSTEVIARTKINSDTGTVDSQSGSLWYEEYLPVESILYSAVMTSQPMTLSPPEALDNADKVMNKVTASWPEIIQIGGNATIGKGLMKPSLLKEDQNA